jgi:hypothetical protein
MPKRAAKPDRGAADHRAVFHRARGTLALGASGLHHGQPALRPAARRWRIWHPFDDPACWRDHELRDALLDASDHFPVTLDLAEPD